MCICICIYATWCGWIPCHILSMIDLPMVDFSSLSLWKPVAQAGKLCTTKGVAAFAAGQWICVLKFYFSWPMFSHWIWYFYFWLHLHYSSLQWLVLPLDLVNSSCCPTGECSMGVIAEFTTPRARRGERCSRSRAAFATCGGLGEELCRRRLRESWRIGVSKPTKAEVYDQQLTSIDDTLGHAFYSIWA